ncbi:hypothetical protein C0431_08930 [bacterium]|nr:hypothetical protein [bacterium]
MKNPIETAKKNTIENAEIFLRNFSHVPDDKLNWSPTPTSKSALRIAAHASLYLHRFAEMIATQSVPAVNNLDEWLAEVHAEETAIKNRDQVDAAFQSGIEAVNNALDSLTPADLENSIDSGQGWSMSMTFLINLPAWHTTLHLGQIDYLQTCWNDQTIYTS